MKLGVLVVFLGLGFISVAQQTTFSVGLGERFEKTLFQGDEYKESQITYYRMGFDHTNNGIIIGLGVSYFHDNMVLDSKKFIGHYHRYDNTRTTTFSHSELSYSYLGANFSIGPSLFNRERFRLRCVADFQVELLMSENESNHTQFGSSIYTSFNPINYDSNSTITSYPTTTDEFDAASLPSDFASLGVDISPEFCLKNYTISPYYSFGINTRWRVFDNWDGRKTSGLNESSVQPSVRTFHEFGVKIGLVSNKKPNPDS